MKDLTPFKFRKKLILSHHIRFDEEKEIEETALLNKITDENAWNYIFIGRSTNSEKHDLLYTLEEMPYLNILTDDVATQTIIVEVGYDDESDYLNIITCIIHAFECAKEEYIPGDGLPVSISVLTNPRAW